MGHLKKDIGGHLAVDSVDGHLINRCTSTAAPDTVDPCTVCDADTPLDIQATVSGIGGCGCVLGGGTDYVDSDAHINTFAVNSTYTLRHHPSYPCRWQYTRPSDSVTVYNEDGCSTIDHYTSDNLIIIAVLSGTTMTVSVGAVIGSGTAWFSGSQDVGSNYDCDEMDITSIKNTNTCDPGGSSNPLGEGGSVDLEWL